MSFLLKLFGSKLAGIGAMVFGLLAVVLKIFMAGKASERAKNAQATLKARRERDKIERDVSSLSDDDFKERADKWHRD